MPYTEANSIGLRAETKERLAKAADNAAHIIGAFNSWDAFLLYIAKELEEEVKASS